MTPPIIVKGIKPNIPKERLHTASEAEALGFTIDHSAAGCWYAYKGPRFAPTEGFMVETESETHAYPLDTHRSRITVAPS